MPFPDDVACVRGDAKDGIVVDLPETTGYGAGVHSLSSAVNISLAAT